MIYECRTSRNCRTNFDITPQITYIRIICMFADFKVIVSSLQKTLFPTRIFLFHPNSDYILYFIMSISIKYVYVVQKNSSRYCLPIIIMMKLCEWTGIINKSIDIHPLCLKIRKQNPLFLNTVYNI